MTNKGNPLFGWPYRRTGESMRDCWLSFAVCRLFVVILSLAPLFAQQQAPAPCLARAEGERAYTRLRLMDVVRDQTPVRAEYLIRTCGIRVPFGPELDADLKEAGAEETVRAAVREVAPRPVVPVPAPKPEAPKPPPGPQAGDIRVNPKDGLRYAFVPPGTFRMGCASDADGPCDNDEKPAHDVQISKGFWMGQTEVTVEAYKRYARAAGKAMPAEPAFNDRKLNPQWSLDSLPMTMVDWNDSRGYCEWAGLRLPTEAEWEYAARGGTTGARYGALDDIAWYGNNSGDSPIDALDIVTKDQGNYVKRIGANGNRPRPVGQKTANRFKLYDLLGNVWEWTGDWYKGSYEGEALERDPQGPLGGEYRVLRGGSWSVDASFVRASIRNYGRPAYRDSLVGFRCTGELSVP